MAYIVGNVHSYLLPTLRWLIIAVCRVYFSLSSVSVINVLAEETRPINSNTVHVADAYGQ